MVPSGGDRMSVDINTAEDARKALERWKATEEAKHLAALDKAYQRGRESILAELEREWHGSLKKLILEGLKP